MWPLVALLLAVTLAILFRRGSTKFKLRGRIGVVTGAANGLGFELALALASKGVHLVLWDVRERDLQHAAQMIEEQCQGAVLDASVVDVADEAAVTEAATRLRASLPPGKHVSLFVNNAGASRTSGCAPSPARAAPHRHRPQVSSRASRCWSWTRPTFAAR